MTLDSLLTLTVIVWLKGGHVAAYNLPVLPGQCSEAVVQVLPDIVSRYPDAEGFVALCGTSWSI